MKGRIPGPRGPWADRSKSIFLNFLYVLILALSVLTAYRAGKEDLFGSPEYGHTFIGSWLQGPGGSIRQLSEAFGPSSSSSQPSPPKPLSGCVLERVGGRAHDGYGAWTLCTDQLPESSIIYSFGIGGDVSFDAEMLRRGHKVYGFDPTVTPEAVHSILYDNHSSTLSPSQLSSFSFTQLGLSAANGVVEFLRPNHPKIHSMTLLPQEGIAGAVTYSGAGFNAAVLRLATVMCMNGHNWLDVLKMDVEGAEFDVCQSTDFQNIPATHVLIEFHDRMVKDGVAKKDACQEVLYAQGFTRVFESSHKEEYAFVRMVPGGNVTRSRL